MPVPMPVIAILKGLPVLSLFVMYSTAVCRPVPTGMNFTVKLVLPPGITVAGVGLVVTVKLVLPTTVIPETVRFELPIFLMVKVRLLLVLKVTGPKSLVLTPLTRFVPRGC